MCMRQGCRRRQRHPDNLIHGYFTAGPAGRELPAAMTQLSCCFGLFVSTHREYRPMEQVSFQDNGTKVAAVNTKTYIFQHNMSRGPESDLIRTVNIPAMVSSTIQPLSSHWIATFLFFIFSKSHFSSSLLADGDDKVQGPAGLGQSDLVLHAKQRWRPVCYPHRGRAAVGIPRRPAQGLENATTSAGRCVWTLL